MANPSARHAVFMTFGIYISTIVLIYVLGVFVAQKVYDRSANPDLPESQRVVARARAGIFWPARFTARLTSIVSRHTSTPPHQGLDIHTDINL